MQSINESVVLRLSIITLCEHIRKTTIT